MAGVIKCQVAAPTILLLVAAVALLQVRVHSQHRGAPAASPSWSASRHDFWAGDESRPLTESEVPAAAAAPAAGGGDPVLEEVLARLLARLEAAAEAVAEAVLDGAASDVDDQEGALVEVRRVMCALVNTRMIGGGCTGYLSGPGTATAPTAQCCRSVRAIFQMASATPLSRRTLCSCFENDIHSPLYSANAPTLLGLPLRCGVPAFAALPLILNPATNCSVIA